MSGSALALVRRSRRLLALAGWTTADQAVSSLSTAGLSILVARAVGAHSFGAFAVAFTVYQFLIGISSAVGGSPFTIRGATMAPDAQVQAMRSASTTALAVGVATGVITAAVGVALGGDAGHSLIAVGLMLGPLFMQDCWRTVLVVIRRPAAALVNDSVWTVLQFVLLGVLVAVGTKTAWPYVVGWGLSGAVAAAVGVRQTRAAPAPRRVWRWLRNHRDLSGFMAMEWITVMGAGQIAMLLVAAVGTVAAVGALRGATTLLGPLNIVAFSAFAFGVPEITRRALDARQRLRVAAGISGLFLLIDLVWTVVLLLLPDAAGRVLLGATWSGTTHVLLPMGLQVVGIGAAWGPVMMLRAMGQVRWNLYVNAVQSPLLVAGGALGALLGGATGAAAGLAAAAWLVLPLWWLVLLRTLSAQRDRPAAVEVRPEPLG